MNNIATLSGELQSDESFPTLTDFGIVNNADLSQYIDTLTALGHTWTQAQFDALNNFVNDGIDQGWYEKMAVIFPFFGDTAECMKVPLKLKFGAREFATIGGYNGYDIDTDWSLVATSNGSVFCGVKSIESPSRRYVALPFDMKELLDFVNKDGYLCGATTVVVETAVSPSTVASDRLFGFTSTDMNEDGGEFIFSFKTLNGTISVGMNRSTDYEAFARENENYFRLEEYSPGVNYSHNGSLADVFVFNREFEAYKLNYTLADKLRIGIGGFPLLDGSADFGNSTKITPDCTMKYWSFETEEICEPLYREAIKELLEAIK